MPVLSVVMSVYNTATYLSQTIESVLAQTLTDFEFVIVDDGSTDNGPDILRHYAEQDARIRIISQANQGTSLALNVGIEATQTDIIARMDSDDLMLPNRLERQLAYFRQHPEASVVSCLAHYINDKNKIIGKNYSDLLTIEDCQRYIRENRIIFCLHPGAMLNKQALEDVGGYRPMLRYAQDIDLWNRLADREHYTIVMPEILMQYRIHPDASMAKVGQRSTMAGWVKHCARLRRKGKPELSYEAYCQQLNSASWTDKIKRKWLIYRDAYYRSAGMMYGSRRYLTFVAYITIAFVMDPRYVLFKLNRQVFAKGSLVGVQEY